MTKNLIGPDDTNARSIVKNLHDNWCHASASQLQRIMADADGAGSTALKVVGSVTDECESYVSS